MAKANNYGLRTRDIGKAGRFAVNALAREGKMGYATAATVGQRWQSFASYAKAEGVKRLEYVTAHLAASHGQALAVRVADGELSAAYAQNLVSAINTVMGHVTQGEWQSVSPTVDTGIASRVNVRTEIPDGFDRQAVMVAVDALRSACMENGAAVVGLARDLGLRAKEGSLLDAKRALQEAYDTGRVTVANGTKGGRIREVPITSERQLETLAYAASVQGGARSLVPTDQTWAQWEEGGLRAAREVLQRHEISRIHELRSAYAVDRYQALTGHLPRAFGGNATKAVDKAARLTIARELGHSRIAIAVSYIGSAR